MKKILLIATILFAVCGVFAKEYAFKLINHSGKTVEIRSVTVYDVIDSSDEKKIKSSCDQLPFTLKNGGKKTVMVAFKSKASIVDVEFGMRCDGVECSAYDTFENWDKGKNEIEIEPEDTEPCDDEDEID